MTSTKTVLNDTIPIPHCNLADSIIEAGLVNVQNVHPKIQIQLRYSGLNNFLKSDIYGCLDSAYLQPKVASMLAVAQNHLSAIDSSLHLLVWDAVRPRSAQWRMWRALNLPVAEKTKYVSNPKNHSVHNYGCAVDLTICNEKGELLDMGTDFDHFGISANIDAEYELINQGLINHHQLENRRLLRKVMRQAGFHTIRSEWWHFNAISRDSAKQLYTLIE